MEQIKVLIVDDHSLVREGIRRLLNKLEDIEVVATLNDGAEAIDYVEKNDIDIILMDIDMPNVNGIEATNSISKKHKDIGIIGLSMHDNKKIVDRFIKAGAKGYLLKNTDAETLITAIRRCFFGFQFIDENLANDPNRVKSDPIISLDATHLLLTTRELEVLKLIAEGLSNKEVGTRLFISTKTVDGHRTSLMRKLDIHSVVGLVKYAIAKGMIES